MLSFFSSRPKTCGLCYFELPKGAISVKDFHVSRIYRRRDEDRVRDTVATEAFDTPLPFSFEDLRDRSAKVELTTVWAGFQASIKRGCEGCKALEKLLYAAAVDDNVGMDDLSLGDEMTIEWNTAKMRKNKWGVYDKSGLLQVKLMVDVSKRDGHLWGFSFDVDYSGGNEMSSHSHPYAYQPPHAREFGDTGSPGTLDRIRRWVKDCDEHHTVCGKHTRQLPDRVLELNIASPSHVSIRLVEGLTEEADYVCLSHRWGPSTLNYRTLKDNLDRQKESIAWESLPKTFQDAASVTSRLGIRYLWIDSLCIVQDDEVDWEAQAAKMCDIYRRAYLTIGASCSADSTEGLFRRSPHAKIQQGGSGGPSYTIRRIPEHPTWDNEGVIQMSYHLPILSRAWVYQERVLSRRTVHYTRYEVVFECSVGLDGLCECQNGPGGVWNGSSADGAGAGDLTTGRKMNHALALKETNQALTRHYWHQIIAEYSGYDISFVSDRLPALAGVARQFGVAHPELGRYAAGMWESSLIYDLMWLCTQERRFPRPRPEGISFPSWSWISVGHHVKIISGCPRVYPDDLEVLEFDVDPASTDEYGAIFQGSLRVRGYVIEGVFNFIERAGKTRPAFQCRQGGPMQFYPDFPLLDGGSDDLETGSPIFCVKTGFVWGGKFLCLILRRYTGRTDFERIGMISEAARGWVDLVFSNGGEKQTLRVI
ncbi:HET-domain-containing protein [Thozetella sp. PMI_491]|nr:HET-domain-containing protein [Thozetella sp. PMI_491]